MSASEIIPGLWVGNMESAVNQQFFRKNNIRAVLNATPDVPNKFANMGVEYMRIDVDDSLMSKDIDKMERYLPHAVSFIHKNHVLEGKNILINCHAGIQRSATIVAAFLYRYTKMNMNQIVGLMVQRRPVVFFGGSAFNFKNALDKFIGCVDKQIKAKVLC